METLLEEIVQVMAEAELLHDETAVSLALDHMAENISRELANSNPVVLCAMNGGLIPTGMLLNRLAFPLQLDYVHATRYRNTTVGHDLEWRIHPQLPLRSRTVLLVDDIYDAGITLANLIEFCHSAGASSIYSAVLVNKQRQREIAGVHPDFIGLDVEDRYVFGCGMDYKGYLRNLPAIYAVRNT